MVNCNPETVSTDYDTSDRLYFEPLTGEDVLEILHRERPLGVILQLGGQTPLKLAKAIEAAGFRILGTSPDSIDVAEDRKRFEALLNRLKLDRPQAGTARSVAEAAVVAERIGYPVLVRPSYVLGGRAMEIVYDETQLASSMGRAILVSPEHPVLVDKFLEDAIEVDVDCVADGRDVVIPGIMEHIEEAGIHSGDSAMVLPPHTLPAEIVDRIRRHTRDLALALKVKGLMNVQYAVKNDQVFVLEVNPRASRTVPFVSKVTGRAWAKVATKVMLGRSLKSLGALEVPAIKHVGIKESVFPFDRFQGADIILGPEMKSTGEVMGCDLTFGAAFAKSQLAAGAHLPLQGGVFISVRNREKRGISFVAKQLEEMGFRLYSTEGTGHALRQANIRFEEVRKLHEGVRPNVLDFIRDGKIQLVINIPGGKVPHDDSPSIRKAAVQHRVPVVTTLAGAQALASALESMKARGLEPRALQDYYATAPKPRTG
jgi:carbamoyl-phosphate synthase large subunit